MTNTNKIQYSTHHSALNADKQYLDLLSLILENPVAKANRTSQKTIGVIGNMMAFDAFPAATARKLQLKSIIAELLGFIKGATTAKEFRELGTKIWDANANANDPKAPNKWLSNGFRKGEDDLGKIYGAQWRNQEDTVIVKSDDEAFITTLLENGYVRYGTLAETNEVLFKRKVDQLANAVDALINDPSSRRIIVSAWNPMDLNKMALPPCHVLHQYVCTPMEALPDSEQHCIFEDLKKKKHLENTMFKTTTEFFCESANSVVKSVIIKKPKYKLDLILYMRSVDVMLGMNFNLASYWTLLEITARISGHAVGELIFFSGDTHIYGNHISGCKELLAKTKDVEFNNSAKLLINPKLKTLKDFEKATLADFKVCDYAAVVDKLDSPTEMVI